MTLTDADREALIKLYIDKSTITIEQVRFLIENDELCLAVNRIYYGIYYALSALAIKNHFSTLKHSQLIGWFNREFIKKGDVNRKIGKSIRRAFENRMEGDYNVVVDFSQEEVEQSFDDMKEVISEMRELIQ